MNKATTEMKIEVSNARIKNAIVLPDGTCKLEVEMVSLAAEKSNKEKFYNGCILVEASKLSLMDAFMKHEPKTDMEKRFKKELCETIKEGVEDFYKPIMDPSFVDVEKKKFHFKAGEKPAIGKSYNWWVEAIKDSPWCIGTETQYTAFLGVLIKELVDTRGWRVCDAWDAVCNDSDRLGHYNYNEDRRCPIKKTGADEVCGFYDLANVSKFFAYNEYKDAIFCNYSDCRNTGEQAPLGCIGYTIFHKLNKNFERSVPWLLLKK